MPLVNITILEGRGSEYGRAVADSVNSAVIDTMDFPADDRFQIINEVPDYALQLQERTGDRLMMHLVMRGGRPAAAKQAFYRQVTQNLARNPGISPDNVVITFTENNDIDWSFGQGKASFIEGTTPFARAC